MNIETDILDATKMSDEQLKSIPASVVSLNLEGAKITDKGISNLPFLQALKA